MADPVISVVVMLTEGDPIRYTRNTLAEVAELVDGFDALGDMVVKITIERVRP
jgi:hypothetical protein